MATIAEIKESRKGRKTYFPFGKWILHPPANYIAWLCIKLNIKPNYITLLSGLSGVTGCVLLAIGDYPLLIMGGFLLLLYLMLDCVDGVVARMTDRVSRYGQFLDVAIGYILGGLMPLSIGLGVYLKTGICEYLLISSFCATAYLLGTSVALLQKSIYGVVILTPGSDMARKLRITLLEVPIIIGCSFSNFLEFYLVFYLMLYSCRFLGVMYATKKCD